jgi:hypothetical protein
MLKIGGDIVYESKTRLTEGDLIKRGFVLIESKSSSFRFGLCASAQEDKGERGSQIPGRKRAEVKETRSLSGKVERD